MTDKTTPRRQPRRDHLIEIAHDLFNHHGFHQTGIDTIMRESGVSKTTLYKYFPAKDDLALEVLKLRSERILGTIRGRLSGMLAARPDATLAERISVILDVIEEWITGSAFFGCNFVRAAAEYPEAGCAIYEQAKAHKRELQQLIADQLGGMDARRRDELASHILLVIEGAISVAQVGFAPEPVADARRLIDMLLGTADNAGP